MNMKQILLVALLACPATAQTSPCLAFNDSSTNTPTGTLTPAPAKLTAFSIATPTALTVRSVRIFTGNAAGKSMKLELRTGGAKPGALLASGTWTSTKSPSWQGCNFDRPVSLAANTPVWLVWHDPGTSTIPTATTGTSHTTLGGISFLGTIAWLSLPNHVLMMQLFCSPLDDKGIVPFGAACVGSAGTSTTVFTNMAPTLGNMAFGVDASGLVPLSNTGILFGTVPSVPGTPIGILGTDPSCLRFTLADLASLSMKANGHGGLHVPLPIPLNPNLKGVYVDCQLVTIDPGSTYPVPLVTSNRLGITIF